MAAINSSQDMSYQSVHNSPLFRHLVAIIQHNKNPEYVSELLKQLFEEVDDSIIFDMVTKPCDIYPTLHVTESIARSSIASKGEGLIHLISYVDDLYTSDCIPILHNINPSYPSYPILGEDFTHGSLLNL
jgi:hypothetical protein